MDQKYIVAIEIGSSKIKGAVGRLDRSNSLTVEAVEEEKLVGDELADAVRYGIIQNVDKVANSLDRIIKRLQASSSVAPRVIESVYVGLGARSMFAKPVEVERSYPDEVDITDAFVDQLKAEVRDSVISDKEVVAVTPRSFTLDDTAAPINPVGQFAHDIRASFMVVAIKPTASRNIKRVVTDRLGLQVAGYIVRPLAEAAFVLNDEERRLGCMLVDFGAETVTATIYKGGVMRYMAVIPMGSRNITRDLMTLNYTEERAENIKTAIGNLDEDPAVRNRNVDGLNNAEINEVISARAREIIANIAEQVKFAGMQNSDLPAGIILVGGGSRLRGFASILKATYNMNVRIGTQQEFLRIADPRLQDNEAIDILSLLTYTAKNSPIECTSNPLPPKDSLFEDEEIEEADGGFITEADDDETTSRIGSDLDGEELFPQKKKKIGWFKGKDQKKDEEEKEDPWADDGYGDDDEDDDTTKGPDNSIRQRVMNSVRERVKKLLTDSDDTNDGFTN